MIHLHVHSTYSLLEGAATPEQLVARAAQCRMEALVLTDTGGLYGAIPFYQMARKAGVKPILGVTLGETVLLARDREGYARICQIVSAHHLAPGPAGAGEVNRALLERMAGLGRGVFVLSGNRKILGELRRRGGRPLAVISHEGGAVSRYRAAQMWRFAREIGVRAVAVNPVFFLAPADRRIHQVLKAIRRNATVNEAPPEAREAGVFWDDSLGWRGTSSTWFRTSEEMERLYADWPEALRHTEWVAERCNVELDLGRPLFPESELPEGESAASYLRELSFSGLRGRYKPVPSKVRRRCEDELDVIKRLGFAPYFLIVADIVREARSRGIPIVGRGSAANSLVAYALGITRVDPMAYDLYFERFLNLSRTDCPDIDLDICWRRREEVIRYVYERYGAERVAMICTFNTFRARGAVREVAKVFGLTSEEVGAITRRLPHYHAGDIRSLVRHLPECRGLRIEEEPLKSIVEIAECIDGFPRHLAVHPCGLVIAPEPLTRFLPLQRARNNLVVTQYDMGSVEDLGLIKMDLLGHRSLTVIADTMETVRENRGIELDIEDLPDPDPLTAGLLESGRTIGCFQIESPAMRALLRSTHARGTDMLIKTLSLVRPGPSGSGMKKHFIDRHLGAEPVHYLHPALEKVLGETYGVMLYQEDVLRVAKCVAGMSLAEADSLRRVMSRKGSFVEMADSMKIFIDRAIGNGVSARAAQQIWEQIANFSKYSYCKAHASTYGQIAYQCTYLKAHFPAEFFAGVLSNRGGFYHPAVYLEEAKRFGIEIRPPDIHRSQDMYSVEGCALRTGLMEVRGLSRAAGKAILEQREKKPFESLFDLFHRTGILPAELKALIRAGVCDGLGRSRPGLMWEFRVLERSRKAVAPSRDRAAAPLLVGAAGAGCRAPRFPGYCRRREVDLQWEALGLTISTHPMEYYLPFFAEHTLVLSPHLPHYAGQSIRMAGWLIAERRLGLRGRGAMKFLTFEDPGGVFEAILLPEAYQHYGACLDSQGPYLLGGEVQEMDDCFSLILEEIRRMGREGAAWEFPEGISPADWNRTPPCESRISHAD